MFSRRQFLATLFPALAGSQVALNAAAEPKKIGHVERGQRTALQSSGSLGSALLRGSVEAIAAASNRGENPISLYKVRVTRIARTGSMRPAIGDEDIVILEAAPYEVLALGDVVIGARNSARLTAEIRDPWKQWEALHRIVGGRPGAWALRGDNNTQGDGFALNKETYTGWRVCAVFHSNKHLAT